MVKFFLPEAKQANPKKKVDYKKLIYTELMQLLKIKHLKYISTIVNAIKAVQQPNPKQIEQLEACKKIKKREMKIGVLYIMAKILQINNIASLESEAHIGKIDKQSILKEVEENAAVKEFVDRVMKSKSYSQKIEKLGQFCDQIGKKKHITKQKLKERKARKRINANQSRKPSGESLNEENSEKDPQSEIASSEHVPKTKVNASHQTLLKPQRREFNSNPKQTKRQRSDTPQNPHRQKWQQKQTTKRTEFIKKGRNKVKDEKNKKKEFYKNIKEKEAKIAPKDNKSKDNQKKQLHPSWAAKKEQPMFLAGKFQGKKIML